MLRLAPGARCNRVAVQRPTRCFSMATDDKRQAVPVSPLARQVYKRLMWAARDYPGGPDKIRAQAKSAIRKHQTELDPAKLHELMAKVDYIVNEIDATCNFHKYRHLRRAYTAEEERMHKELLL